MLLKHNLELILGDGQIFTLGLGDFHGKLNNVSQTLDPIYTEEVFASKNPNSPKLISCRKFFSSSSLDLPKHVSFNASQIQGQLSPLPMRSVDLTTLHGLSMKTTTLLKGDSSRFVLCFFPKRAWLGSFLLILPQAWLRKPLRMLNPQVITKSFKATKPLSSLGPAIWWYRNRWRHSFQRRPSPTPKAIVGVQGAQVGDPWPL